MPVAAPRVAVSALAFVSAPDRLLVCNGDCVRLFESGVVTRTSRLEPRGTALHGIAMCKEVCGAVACWGSRFLTLMDAWCSVEVGAIDLGEWILAARFVRCDQVAAVLAKSEVAIVSAVDGSVVRRFSMAATGSASPALLQCAVVASIEPRLTIVAGTLAGSVRTWSDDVSLAVEGVGSAVYCIDVRSDERVACGCDNRALIVLGQGKVFGHAGRIWDVKWTRDDEIVSGGEDGTLRWWKCGDTTLNESVFVGKSAVRRLAVAEEWAACGCDDGSVSVWKKPMPLQVKGATELAPGTVRCLAIETRTRAVLYAADGRLYRAGEYKYEQAGTMIVFIEPLHGGKTLLAFKHGSVCLLDERFIPIYYSAVCNAAVCCAVSEKLAVVASFHSFAVVDILTGAVDWRCDKLQFAAKETVTACAVLGSLVAIGGSKGSVVLFRKNEKAGKVLPGGHSDAVTDLRLVLGGTLLMSLCRDGRVGRWDVESGELMEMSRLRCVQNCECAESFVGDAIVRVHSSQGAFLCSLEEEGGVVIGRIPKLLQRCLFAGAVVRDVLVAVAVLPGTRTVSRFEWPLQPQHVQHLQGSSHSCLVNAVAVNSQDGLVATVGDDGRWAVWEPENGLKEPVFFRKSGSGSIRAASWWKGALLLASATRLYQWRGAVCKAQLELAAEENSRVMWMVVLAHGCVMGNSSGRVTLVDLALWNVVERRNIASYCLSGACLTDDKDAVAIVTTRGDVMHLTASSLTVQRQCRVSVSSLSAVANCGSFQVCAGDDGATGWSVHEDGSHKTVFLGHAAAVVALAVSEGRKLFSLSNDQTIRCFSIGVDGLSGALCSVAICVAHPSSFAVLAGGSQMLIAGEGLELVEVPQKE